MPEINFKSVQAVHYGGQAVSKIYAGTVKVWEKRGERSLTMYANTTFSYGHFTIKLYSFNLSRVKNFGLSKLRKVVDPNGNYVTLPSGITQDPSNTSTYYSNNAVASGRFAGGSQQYTLIFDS